MPRHYSGRIPPISVAFGWYIQNKLIAVCTFGKPASPFLCSEICGEEYKNNVYELNRLCMDSKQAYPLSHFVSRCLKKLKQLDLIIVSFSDTAMNHNGYIYQACNFIYTGKTKERTDKYTVGNKHCRHYANSNPNIRKIRSAKHRYVYFCTSKKKRKKFLKLLKYSKVDFPKGENKKYILGEYLKPKFKIKRIKYERHKQIKESTKKGI